MNVIDLVGTLPVHPTKTIPTRKLSSIKKIVIHTTDWVITPQDLAKYDIGPNHISKSGCPTITYHRLVYPDGTTYKTAKDEWILWHAGFHNGNSIAVSMVYRTDPLFEQGRRSSPLKDENVPTHDQLVCTENLIAELCLQYKIPPTEVKGHRELLGTGFIFVKGHKELRKSCPGMAVNLDVLRGIVAQKMQAELGVKVDGVWGPISQKALELKNS